MPQFLIILQEIDWNFKFFKNKDNITTDKKTIKILNRVAYLLDTEPLDTKKVDLHSSLHNVANLYHLQSF